GGERGEGGGRAAPRDRRRDVEARRAMAVARKKKRRKKPTTRYDRSVLDPLIAAARRGDCHAILGFEPGTNLAKALADPPAWGDGSYEKLLALYIARTRPDGKPARELADVIYNFAENTFFRYDDEGYCLAQVNCDLAGLYATHPCLIDEKCALDYLEAALQGPYPAGVKQDLAALLPPKSVLRRRVARVR